MITISAHTFLIHYSFHFGIPFSMLTINVKCQSRKKETIDDRDLLRFSFPDVLLISIIIMANSNIIYSYPYSYFLYCFTRADASVRQYTMFSSGGAS